MGEGVFDVIVVGGGPAGAACASFSAMLGLRVLVLEREIFPREKVCGDCLNPGCWPIFERLGIRDAVCGLPQGRLDRVDFIGLTGRAVSIDLPGGRDAEISIKRSLLDELLLKRARSLGATIQNSCTVTALESTSSGLWHIRTSTSETFEARIVIGADGRNSTVARLLNLAPVARKDRVAQQTHISLPPDFGNRIVLELRPEGYSGQAPTGENHLNVCLVSTPSGIAAMREWARVRFDLSPNHVWRTVTPLTRAPVVSSQGGLFFIGDAARVVEPFTGEGIFYALASGEIVARVIARLLSGGDRDWGRRQFVRQQRALYSGRLWINRMARAAVLSPRIASAVVNLARFQPALLRLLTSKVVRLSAAHAAVQTITRPDSPAHRP